MSSSVDKIKERLSIVDVVSSYLTLQKAGKNYKAKCPFHNEKTPSFFLSPDRGMYYCFGCGAKGDIFSFVEHFEGTDFLGALKILAERAGVELTEYQGKDGDKDKKNILYKIMEEATLFYEKNLNLNIEAKEYLLGRGLNEKSIKNFRIGYALDSWNSVFDYLVKKGFKQNDIELVGLIKENNNKHYDRFRGRIMFPVNDSSGRVIAFSGRILKQNPNSKIEEAKYLNSPDTPLFDKSNVLFGLDKAKSAIRKNDYTIVVEGQMDLILSHQAGFINTVAVSGTAFTDTTTSGEEKVNNLGLIKRLSSNIIFAYDGDNAGIRAATRSAIIALSLDMQVKVVLIPEEGKDPADIIKEDPKKWKEMIKNKIDIITFNLNKICENTKEREPRRRQIEEKIFPFLKMINSAIKKSNYIKEIYEKTGIPEKAIEDDYKKYESRQLKEDNSNPNINKNSDKEISRRLKLERRLVGIIFWGGDKYSQKIKNLIKFFEEDIGTENYTDLINKYKDISKDLSFEAELWYNDKNNILIDEVREIILNLEEEILNDEQYSLLLKIKEQERIKDKEKLKEDLINYQKIVEKIEKIKNNRKK